MTHLVMMKGLPGSGKSTRARVLVDRGYARVNKDDLRAMLHNSKWSRNNEAAIIGIRDNIVVGSLRAGRNIVVDDTNFEPKHEETLRGIAKQYNATFVVEFIDTPLDVCIEQDLKRLNSVGEKVIRRMYNKYLRVIETPKKLSEDSPACYIFDIDGTLAHLKDRSPYDESKVSEDTVDEPVLAMNLCIAAVRKLTNANLDIIIMSGRHDSCREETEQWLKDNDVQYDHLYMRKTGDDRNDAIIKAELYEEHINGKYRVCGVFDDRDRVVVMWRNKGLPVFQVAEGDF